MNTSSPLEPLLSKVSYLDDMIHEFKQTHDSTLLRLLLEDPNYAELFRRRFFYQDNKSVLRDLSSFEQLNDHIHAAIQDLNCWFNCTRRSMPHRSPHIRFLFVYSGACICEIEGKEIRLQAGDTCIVPAGQLFSHSGMGENCYLIHMLLSPNYLRNTLMNKIPRAGVVPSGFIQSILDPQEHHVLQISSSDSQNRCQFMLCAMSEYLEKRLYYHEAFESYTVLLITDLLRQITVSSQTDHFARTESDKRLVDIRLYIDLNLKTASLSEAAEHFHFTPSYLSQYIRKKTGKTFVQLLQEARLKEATRLLLYSDMKITEIVHACGYQNVSYFYRIFTRNFDCSPSEYRQKNYSIEAGRAITDGSVK